MPIVVVTRPQPDASLWVQQLQDTGIDACALPMMVIGPTRDPQAQACLLRALQQLPRYRALMFVSGNAVRHFFGACSAQGVALPTHTLCWSPGPGTSNALLSCDVPAQNIVQPAPDAPQFESETLWAQAKAHIQAGDSVLIVRGGDGSHAAGQGRQWLSAQLQQQGVHVDFVSVYERQAPTSSSELLAQISTLRAQNALWLFSSSECVQHLVHCHTSWSWHVHTALVTHPRIADQARRAGFGLVHQTMPSLHSIATSIKSLA